MTAVQAAGVVLVGLAVWTLVVWGIVRLVRGAEQRRNDYFNH